MSGYVPIVNPDQVRAAIDVSLDSVVLPDDVIYLGLYAGSAIETVKRRDPAYATRTDVNDQAHLNKAATLLAAALVVFAVPNVTRETYAQNEGYQRQPIDPVLISAQLSARAEEEIQLVVNPGSDSVVDDRPKIFGLACARRGL